MKRKLTLGLLVFFIGVFIASCGSKKSSNNTTTNTETTQGNTIPNTFDLDPDNSCSSCSKDISGTYEVLNENLYLQAYGYVNNNNGYNGFNNYQDYNLFQSGTVYDNLLNSLANSLINPALGAVQCGTQIWVTEQILDLFDFDNTSQNYNCTSININETYTSTGGNNSNYNLNSSYPYDMRLYYSNSVVNTIDVKIRTNINGRNGDQFRLRRKSANVYSTDDNRIQMTNDRGTLMFSSGGQAFGRIR